MYWSSRLAITRPNGGGDGPVSEPFSLTLRAGTQADIEGLAAITVAANADFIGRLPAFANRQGDLKRAFENFVPDIVANSIVAERDGALLGYAAIEGQSDQIGNLWVDPAEQGQGIGAVLLAAAEAKIRRSGHSCAWLVTHAGNARATGFYRTNGYSLLNVSSGPWGAFPEVTLPKALLGKQLSRPDAAKADTMTEVRRGIDTLDPMIVSLLAERFAFIDRAAELKPALAMPARVSERVEEVVMNAREQAKQIGFDPVLTEKLWRTMVDLAIAREEDSFEANRQKDAS
jgi:isochorismate pyruvate lyase